MCPHAEEVTLWACSWLGPVIYYPSTRAPAMMYELPVWVTLMLPKGTVCAEGEDCVLLEGETYPCVLVYLFACFLRFFFNIVQNSETPTGLYAMNVSTEMFQKSLE